MADKITANMADKIYTGDDAKRKEDIEDIFASTILSAKRKLKQTRQTKENYDFTHPYRGLAVIISNEHFKSQQLGQRDYSTKEIREVTKALTKLEFTPIAFQDLTAQQINWVMDVAADQTRFHNKSDCFACVVASHGEERSRTTKKDHPKSYYHDYRDHCIYGVDDVMTPTKSLIDTIAECDGLNDKPKIFLIQACRSRKDEPAERGIDHGFELDITPSEIKDKLNIASPGASDKLEQENGDVIECLESNHSEDDSRFERKDLEKREVADRVTANEQNNMTTSDNVDISVEKNNTMNVECNKHSAKTYTDATESPWKTFASYLSKLCGQINNDNKQTEVVTTISPACREDCIIVYSSSLGKESYGRDGTGGWMLYAISIVILHFSEYETQDLDLIAIVTKANRLISGFLQTKLAEGTENPYRKSVAVIEHCLQAGIVL